VATGLGLLGIIVFIACVIALAAGVTWVVVRVSPKPGGKKKTPPAEPAA
jgi:hypothetical protein